MSFTSYNRPAEQVIIRDGIGPELRAVLRGVEESTIHGEQKYPTTAYRELAQAVACRNYARMLNELAHLAVIALACARKGDAGFAHFFWGMGPAREGVLRGHLLAHLPQGPWNGVEFSATTTGILLHTPHGSFTVNYRRLPVLATCMELLVSTIGYAVVADPLAELLHGEGITLKRISALAGQWSQRLYLYLDQQLPTAQHLRKFRRLNDFLEERLGRAYQPGQLDDGIILEFWLAESPREGGDGADFKSFTTVARAVINLRRVLRHALEAQGMEHPLLLGPGPEGLEVTAGGVVELVAAVEEECALLERLATPPLDRVKFMTQKESAALRLVVESGREGRELVHTLLRCELFGGVQQRITNGLRQKLAPEGLATLVSGAPPVEYGEQLAGYRELAGDLARIKLASWHRLLSAAAPAAALLLVEVAPGVDLTPLAAWVGSGAGDAAGLSARLRASGEDPAVVGAELAGVVSAARKAGRGVARQGFREESAGLDQVHALGIRLMAQLQGVVERFLERSATVADHEWAAHFAQDRERFAAQFTRLYLD